MFIYSRCGHLWVPPDKSVKIPYWQCATCGNGKVPADMNYCPVCKGTQAKEYFALNGCPICNKTVEKNNKEK